MSKFKQSQVDNQLGYSTSSLQRYRNDINMLSRYRIQLDNTNKRTKKLSNTNFDNNYFRDHDLKRPQLTSLKDKLQDLNSNQLKLEVNDTYKKDEKITKNFEPVNDGDVINKAYLDSNILKIDGHISILEKNLQRI